MSNVGQGCQKNVQIVEFQKYRGTIVVGWLNSRAESAELDNVPAFTPVINLLKVQLLYRGFEEQRLNPDSRNRDVAELSPQKVVKGECSGIIP